MPAPPYRPRALQWQVFRGSHAIAQGLLTIDQLRSSAWLRVRHDLYADARLDRDHALACEATSLWLPDGAAIAGPSAAYLDGVEHAATFAEDVHVVTPPDRRAESRKGIRVHHHPIDETEMRVAGGIRRTTPIRTAWDLANWLNVVPAVTIIDGLLRRGLVTPGALGALAASRAGRRGWRRAERAFDLADGRAESPPESALRVRIIQAGLPRPEPQHPVRLAGGSVYHPDLPWPDYQVAVEYDGHWHSSVEQLRLDRRRLNELVAAGWIILHATDQHLRTGFRDVIRQAREALQARGWNPRLSFGATGASRRPR